MKVKELIKQAVKEKAESGNEFSAYDVLIETRDRANKTRDALVDSSGTVLPIVFVPEIGRHSYDLRYADYRSEIFDEINQYDLTIRNTQMCRMFSGKPSAAAAVLPGIRVAGGNAIKHLATVVMTNPQLRLDTSLLVKDYLKRIDNGGSVTIKQIQSDLKRGKGYKSIPSSEIKVIVKSLGYMVDEKAPIKQAIIRK